MGKLDRSAEVGCQLGPCRLLIVTCYWKFWDNRTWHSWNTSAGDDEKKPPSKTQTEPSSKTPEN